MRQVKEVYDKRVHGKPYNVGDRVWLHSTAIPAGTSQAFYRPWHGPFVVDQRMGSATYAIRSDSESDRKMQIVHFNRLKPYFERQLQPDGAKRASSEANSKYRPRTFYNNTYLRDPALPLVIQKRNMVERYLHDPAGINIPPGDGRRYPQRERRPPAFYQAIDWRR